MITYRHKYLVGRTASKVGNQWIINTGQNHFKDVVLPHALLEPSDDRVKVETIEPKSREQKIEELNEYFKKVIEAMKAR